MKKKVVSLVDANLKVAASVDGDTLPFLLYFCTPDLLSKVYGDRKYPFLFIAVIGEIQPPGQAPLSPFVATADALNLAF